MVYLTAEGLSKDLGERILFEHIDLTIARGDKIALVARNGTGKTSLLKILAGVEEPDAGIVRLKKGVRLGYLSQEVDFDEDHTIQEMIDISSTRTLQVVRDYEAALEAQTEHFSTDNQRTLERATAAMDEAEAWDFERRLKEMLTRFDVTHFDQPISSLSGGQKKRLAIALALIQHPDILLMDEPTNHLDIDMIEWLESYLSRSKMSLFVVSHDRYFLDTVCNQIVEMDREQLQVYNGNYAYFLEKKAQLEEARQSEIDKAKQFVRSELDWMRRSPKARTTKSRSRIQAFYDTEEKAKSGRRESDLELSVKMTRIGGKILELKKINKKFDEKVILKGFDYTFKKGERVGIVGKNGTGKSTFLNLIMDLEQADSGKINRGDTIVFGYYSQEGLQLKADKRVIDVLKDVGDVIELANGKKVTASQLLNLFLFPPAMQHQPVSKLSGGEKRRLHLLTVLMLNPNFLILDEPTNDLDLITLNKLEQFLDDYNGCVLMVSHDRYFLDRLVDHLFIFEGDGHIRDFNGSYSEYRSELEENEKDEKKEQVKAEQPRQRTEQPKTKLSFKEKYEFEELEKEIASLEEEKVKLEEELKQTNDYEALSKATTRLGEVVETLNTKTDRWLELSEYI